MTEPAAVIIGQRDPFPLDATANAPLASLPHGHRRVTPRPAPRDEQVALIAAPAEPEPPSLPYLAAGPGPLSAALRGDGYGWLGAVLPAPVPIRCEAHRAPMRLAGTVPLLWECPDCDAERLKPQAPVRPTARTRRGAA
jgi:hypothetical protein